MLLNRCPSGDHDEAQGLGLGLCPEGCAESAKEPESAILNTELAFFSKVSMDLSNWNVDDSWESIHYPGKGLMMVGKKWPS